MINSRIIGANGTPLNINGEGELSVTIHTHPPIDEKIESLPFRSYFKTTAGASDMRVDGSTTPVQFSIDADGNYDYYIKTISVKLADAGAKFNLFGALAALGTGVSFVWKNNEVGSLTIHDGIKDNLEWYRLSEQIPTIIDLSGGGADAVTVHIDLSRVFGTPYGLRLPKGTTAQLIFTVNDNLSAGLDEFNIIGYGIKI